MLLKNVASQGVYLFSYDTVNNVPKTGDSANTTGSYTLDGTDHTGFTTANPTELGGGLYWQPLSQGETNGNLNAYRWASTTTGVQIDPVMKDTSGVNLPAVAPGAANGIFIAGTNAATVITTSLTTAFTGNLTGSVASVSGAVGSVTGAVGSVTGAVGSVTGNVGGNVVGSTASVSGAVGSVTGNVGGNVTGSVGSVTGAVGSVTGAVGSVTGNVGGNVVGSAASVSGAVGSVTGNVGGNVVGSVASVTAAVTVSLTQALGAARALDSIADTSLTLNDALQCAIAVYAGKWAITGTSWVCQTPFTGTTIRTFTLDSATAPTTRS